MKKKKISIWLSGAGSNAESLIRYFGNHPAIEVASVLSNAPQAPAIERLRPLGHEVQVYTPEQWKKPDEIAQKLQNDGIDLIVLAGFLAIVHEPLLTAFEGRIVNLHPSLLPKYGGKGMWGHHVHEAVIAAGDTESGITVHVVSGKIDGGHIIARHTCPVLPTDTPALLEERIHHLEHRYYPPIVEQYLLNSKG